MPINTNTYVSRLQVRPDDIDMFGHVHSSRYVDYVLAARFDQMERCYGMKMQVFLERGYGWVLVSTEINFKRALGLGEHFDVETRIVSLLKNTVEVHYRILTTTGKESCTGWARYAFYNLRSKKSEAIPDWVIEQYSI
jgi:acyl-CoA thioester hydrolase/thioesterase-3